MYRGFGFMLLLLVQVFAVTYTIPVRSGTMTLTQVTLPSYTYNAIFQVYQNGRYWFLGTNNGQHRILDAIRRVR